MLHFIKSGARKQESTKSKSILISFTSYAEASLCSHKEENKNTLMGVFVLKN